MDSEKFQTFAESYCYGPADLGQICKGDSTLWVHFRDSAGKQFEAVYEGCIYWNLEPEHQGYHLSLVERLTAEELKKHPRTLQLLQRNTEDVPRLLKEWEDAGLSLFLHTGAEKEQEYLVVAQGIVFRAL